MSIILAIETSTDCASIALLKHGQVFLHELDEVKTHSAGLIPAIEMICAEAKLNLTEINVIAYGAGPGAFTGLRTACGVVQGLAFGLGVACVPILSLHAMAQSCLDNDKQYDVVCVLDARMNEVYWAHYRYVDGQFENPIPAKLSSVDEAFHYAKQNSIPLVLGKGVEYGGDTEIQLFQAMPHAREIVQLAQFAVANGAGTAPELVQPIYLRNKIAQTTLEREASRKERIV